jgi:alkanesulfonate monooxygenase SsuD/methylene tetrahydromethanopterin reductase-like flavin-dependent oxidoreductase (luciferase family)
MPRPVQPELPVWITSGGARPTFELAGTLGCGVLTHLVGQDPEALSANIAAYRKTRSAAGDGRGHVTLMLHTHVHDGSAAATERAEAELARYLTSSMRLDASNTADPGTADAMRNLNSADRGAIAGLGAARYLDLGLICTSAEVPQRLAEIDSWDVDEIACLIDFGFDHGTVMRSLDELLTVLA